MMATVPHVTSGLGLRKFQADGFLFDRMYVGFTEWALSIYFIQVVIYNLNSNKPAF